VLGEEEAVAMLSRGFSIVELMITLAVLGMLAMIALPNMGTWIQNTQIRTAAEGAYAGLTLARAEALKRNTTVRFQLTNDLTNTCSLNSTGRNWVVSLADPTANCDVDPSETVAPQIVQKRAGSEGSPNVEVAGDGSFVFFNGIGRAGVGSMTTIDFTSTANGACKTPGGTEPMRCLRITISPGGQVRLCDPAVSAATDPGDPRLC
jgi:type IV fimbrial biogenesis protein FimT